MCVIAVFVLGVVGFRLVADEGCPCEPPNGEVEGLEREIGRAEREGDLGRAAELKARLKEVREEAARRAECAGRAIKNKKIEDELEFLLRNRQTREFLTHQAMGYLMSVNLVNGLNLSDEQMRTILKCLRKKERILKADQWRRVIRGYLAVRDMLERGGPLTEEARDVFMYTETLFLYLDREKDRVGRDLERLVDEVHKCLTDGQREVVRTFIPCHLPPREMTDPVRAGQARTPGHELNMLKTAREMVDWEFERWFAKEIAPMARHRAEVLKTRPEDEVRRVRRIFEKARRMSRVDFELNRNELAGKLDIVDPQPGTKEVTRPERVREKIRDFLLNERLIDLLERRLKASAEAGRGGKDE